MVLEDLREQLTRRLNEAERGDRGWWLVTRVHLTPARIVEVARYLAARTTGDRIDMTEQHYAEIGQIVGMSKDAEKNIKRHLFLAMDQPLGLIERINANSWSSIRLTEDGRRLASSEDPIEVFEQVLHGIRFCRVPWYSKGRQDQYAEFDVAPYPAMLAVLRASAGYVDMDEFDLFVSRIRTDEEVVPATASINAFRLLRPEERSTLLRLVEERIPAEGEGKDKRKAYHNWRDVARHTFSLFSLGVSAEREGNRLWLASELLIEADVDLAAPVPLGRPAGEENYGQITVETSEGGDFNVTETGARQAAFGANQRLIAPRSAGTPQYVRPITSLLIPDGAAPLELLEPPAGPQANDGFDAELLVAKIFKAKGWQVAYYGRKRGFGFDLWAKKEDQAFVIEVKSFSSLGGSVVLTETEHAAAHHHGSSYLLVIVEMMSGTPQISVIADPMSVVQATDASTRQYSIARSAWLRGAVVL